jgi:hypothetical protein
MTPARLLCSLLTAILLLMPALSHANLTTDAVQRAGFDKLTEQQKAELIKQIATQATPELATTLDTPQKVTEWVDVGTKIGQMMGGAAKELGVQVNEFAKTPVGKWTMALIVWKFMGDVIMHAFGGVLVFITGISFVLFMARRYTRGTVDYDPEKRDYLGRSVKIKEERRVWTDGDTLMFGFYFAVVTGAALITIFTF